MLRHHFFAVPELRARFRNPTTLLLLAYTVNFRYAFSRDPRTSSSEQEYARSQIIKLDKFLWGW